MYPWMVPVHGSIHGYMGMGILWVRVWVSPQAPVGLPMQNPMHDKGANPHLYPVGTQHQPKQVTHRLPVSVLLPICHETEA